EGVEADRGAGEGGGEHHSGGRERHAGGRCGRVLTESDRVRGHVDGRDGRSRGNTGAGDTLADRQPEHAGAEQNVRDGGAATGRVAGEAGRARPSLGNAPGDTDARDAGNAEGGGGSDRVGGLRDVAAGGVAGVHRQGTGAEPHRAQLDDVGIVDGDGGRAGADQVDLSQEVIARIGEDDGTGA